MTEEDEAAVVQYGWLKKVADSVRGGGMCVFHNVHVGASVDVVIELRARTREDGVFADDAVEAL